jgi:hypothetical protein
MRNNEHLLLYLASSCPCNLASILTRQVLSNEAKTINLLSLILEWWQGWSVHSTASTHDSGETVLTIINAGPMARYHMDMCTK